MTYVSLATAEQPRKLVDQSATNRSIPGRYKYADRALQVGGEGGSQMRQ
jgi:hypothetical protein